MSAHLSKLSQENKAYIIMLDVPFFLAFIGFAFSAAMTPGPNNLLLMSSGAMYGLKRTVPHICGVFIGFNFLMLAAIFGLDAVMLKWPFIITFVKIVGSAWLAWMGYQFLQTAFSTKNKNKDRKSKTTSRPFRFYEAVLFQWVNPKALLMAGLTAGSFVNISDNFILRTTLICSVFLICGMISATTWTIAGSTLNRLMSSGKSAKTLNIIMGLLLIGTAVMILMTKAHT